ncbi:MAG: AbrB/MazE/SpoVT family DNA-binding domain-containing protein [Thermoplasmatales archaeon]|nr:AbrB/MazE/SpoVT family DNA-binding domain-containing protein [Thermoplasmatales archaeon]
MEWRNLIAGSLAKKRNKNHERVYYFMNKPIAQRDAIISILLSIWKLIYVRNSLLASKNMLLKLSKITSKGQITIPAGIRRVLGLEVGDTIIFEKKDGDIIIKKNIKGTLVSILEETGPLSQNAKKIIKNIRDEWH